MRITGGEARGRLLRAPRGHKVRPTADKVRAAIFNILEARYEISEKRTLDLFAGSGALGLDALSRGAASVVFVEESRVSCAAIRDNIARCGFAGRAKIVQASLPRGLRKLEGMGPFEGVFLDPPYGQDLCPLVLAGLDEAGVLAGGAWVVVEHARDDRLLEGYGRLHRVDHRTYGSTAISTYVESEGE